MTTQTLEDSVTAEAANLLRMALPLMSKYHVPVTPQNYAVWYRYASGGDPELRAAVDEHIAKGEEFTPSINDMLYHRYVLDTNEKMLEAVRQSMRVLIDGINSSMTTPTWTSAASSSVWASTT